MTVDNVFLGTSGYSYTEWEGPFYQKGEKSKLRAYAQVFSTVEIDSTWYRFPSKGTVMGWLRYSPADFVFAAKIPKLITHDKKIGLKGDVQSDLDRFFELMNPLQLDGKLACFLIQLPPSLSFNADGLESFFQNLGPQYRFAVEFRHLSWMRDETWRLLEKYHVAYTNVDEPLLPPEVHLTTDFAYFRWHGRGSKPWFDYRYKDEELDQWVPKVKNAAEKVKKVYGYFNNHFHGYAPENCMKLLEKLGLLTDQQLKARRKISQKQVGLTDYF